MMSKHIAFFGSSLLSAYWNGAATYYRGILAALAKRGHRITFYEPDAYERQRYRDMPAPSWANVIVYPCSDATSVRRCLDAARHADIVIKASGVGVFDEFLEAAVANLAGEGPMVVFWDVDAPATLARVQQATDDPFRRLIPRYDLILTYGGGPAVVAKYKTLGAKACVPIYNGLDPSTHYPVPASAELSADLVFLGNRLPDRETRVDHFFFEAARQLPEKRFLLAGSGWESKPRPTNVHLVGHVFTHQHNALNASAEFVLNINRDSMATTGYSPPTRVFEAAGAGACIITDEWDGIEAFFRPGREILIASDVGALVQHLQHQTPERRTAIGAAARARALQDHTYGKRAYQVERALEASFQARVEAPA